jgi:hypothetical protein
MNEKYTRADIAKTIADAGIERATAGVIALLSFIQWLTR